VIITNRVNKPNLVSEKRFTIFTQSIKIRKKQKRNSI
jgi:hypothetical protein